MWLSYFNEPKVFQLKKKMAHFLVSVSGTKCMCRIQKKAFIQCKRENAGFMGCIPAGQS
jgi:hypothetical protein